MGKTIESDNEYDLSSDIDNQCDSDDDYDDDLNDEDNTESFNVLHSLSLIDKMHVSLGRPDVPLQAAKLASETGVALRDKLPIYTSWKLYEKDGGPVEVQKVLDKVANRLDVDVKNDGPSKSACTDIIKKGVKQQRYHLKRKYFDESLAMEQLLAKEPPPKMKKEEWIELVKYWCDPKNQIHGLHHCFC
ncbi:uncharacterized protein LOC112898098 [Panicum hallii]|uniref:uncharacterized protein LOC112898098 n=1 Tax=Panicum hallii TaxID=206008 RepID=UPI000DF4ED3C|nr:uncharacterized protein LOC112898098 [Panicum hallii]